MNHKLVKTYTNTKHHTSDCRRTEEWPCIVTPLLKDSRWLRVPERITYNLVQMSQRLSIAVSVWTTPASRWPWVKAEAAIIINFSTGCAVHATIGDRAFTDAAPRAWNSLPDSLHRLSSLQQFKKHLKTHLFKISFAQQDSLWLYSALEAACVAYSSI